MADEKEVKQKGIDELHKQLSDKGVTVDKKDLEEAVKASREHMVQNCDGCANGWHW